MSRMSVILAVLLLFMLVSCSKQDDPTSASTVEILPSSSASTSSPDHASTATQPEDPTAHSPENLNNDQKAAIVGIVNDVLAKYASGEYPYTPSDGIQDYFSSEVPGGVELPLSATWDDLILRDFRLNQIPMLVYTLPLNAQNEMIFEFMWWEVDSEIGIGPVYFEEI